METIYLKAPDKATFDQALIDAGWAWETTYQVEVDEQGNETVTDVVLKEAGVEAYSATHSLDIVGDIHVPTGEFTTETAHDGTEFQMPVLAQVEGYHANLRLHGEELPEALAGFVIEAPATPIRVFA